MGNQPLAQMATRTFGKQGVFAQQLHTALKAGAGLPIFANAHVTRGYAAHPVLGIKQHFGCGKTGKDIHAQSFCFLREPFADGP